MVLCKTLRIGRIPTTGFVLSADKYTDAKPFTTTLHISYPARPGATVSLVKVGETADACIQDAVLDSAGKADVQYNVQKTQTLYAMVKEGDCCTTFSYPPCLVSNYINFEVPLVGSINFSSVPGGAEIFIDGEDQLIKTPATITDVPVGQRGYTLKLTGFKDYTGNVLVEENKTAQVSAVLVPAEGCVYFNTTPPGARIFIDDIEQAGITTPAIICGLTLGPHKYRLVLEGYQDITGNIDLPAGKGVIVTVTFEKKGIGTGTILGLGLLGASVLGAVIIATRGRRPPLPPREYLEFPPTT